MSKPLWVYVYWSENAAFTKNSLLSFLEFEIKCKEVVIKLGIDYGYDKTKIKVLFDDGGYYETTLDLCPQGDTGFQSYCESMIQWIGSDRFMKAYGLDQPIIDEYESQREYLLNIEWP